MRRGGIMIRPSSLLAPIVCAVLLGSSTLAGAEDLTQLQTDSDQWVLPGKDYSLTRFSELEQINTANVANLTAAWTFSTGVLRGHEGAPLVVGDTMYVVTPFPNIVYALDLTKPGAAIKWKYAPQQEESVIPIACCDVVNRGVAYADARIFFNQLDTHTVALDAKTGAELWKVKQGDHKKGFDHHDGAARGSRQGHHGNQRRRVRRTGLRHRERRQDRKAGLADVQHRPRRGRGDRGGFRAAPRLTPRYRSRHEHLEGR